MPLDEISEMTKEAPLMKSQTNTFSTKTPRRSQSIIVTFVLAALIVLFIVLYPGKKEDTPEYELRIKELGGDAMLVHSTSEELGYGEILLVYGENMVVEDVNGQIIDFAELSLQDKIRVTIAPFEDRPEYHYEPEYYYDRNPVVEKIVLLPDGSDEYI
jgi:hypothetical protein